ncbi:uncharacterized protein LY89DRAFT_716570 [Mollisia scopiformis]|uniref:Uncharacterized protein n=1 Tax=Mollisia scopiformis TaxID=149040 RepID=A0A194XJ22_MOLSC|nr:uncharacterized protein LY89DRAFT_716570 [Mollisia scopiformis]KUJ20124.1 hypothetical protein LY89DRAFT_716570 [Mollisia scopiformis]
MLFLLLLPLLALNALSSPTPDLLPRDPALKPYQLRGVQSPIFHLYLQSLPSSKSTPVMGPESSSEYFNLDSSIQSLNSSLYLNIGPKVDGKSYLPLSLDATSNTTAWALEGDTVITSTASTYGRQLNFLACASSTSGYYTIYLQTGSDVPSGVTCSNYQTIHTPCLC